MSEEMSATALQQLGSAPPQKTCNTCRAPIHLMAEICPKCGVRQRNPVSKPALLLLTFFFGGIGAHKFYTGRNWQGALYLVFCWTYIPGIIALVEFVIYCFTSSERLNEKYSAKGSAVVVIIVAAVAFFLVIGILAAVALPAYQGYTKKAKASEGLLMASKLQSRITEAFTQRPQDMSCSATSCNLGTVELSPTKYVKQLYSDRSGIIHIEYDEQLFSSPKNILTITPIVDGAVADLSSPASAGKILSWKCGQDGLSTVPLNSMPASCH